MNLHRAVHDVSFVSEASAAREEADDLVARLARRGPEPLTDVELLALVLGGARGSRAGAQRAAALLAELGGVGRLASEGVNSLADRLDERTAARLAAAVELGRRVATEQVAEREVLANFASVVRWAKPRLLPLDHEEVWMLGLDGRNGVRCARRIGQGGLHGCALLPRDVLRTALREAASALVLVHNHPSGDPSPSPEDVHMTRCLAAACDVVGVPLIDHVVVARGGASSLLELGVLAPASPPLRPRP